MTKLSDFEVQGCSSVTERFQKALVDSKSFKNSDGVDHLSAEQTNGICNFKCRKDVYTGLPTVCGKSLLFPNDSWLVLN